MFPAPSPAANAAAAAAAAPGLLQDQDKGLRAPGSCQVTPASCDSDQESPGGPGAPAQPPPEAPSAPSEAASHPSTLLFECHRSKASKP